MAVYQVFSRCAYYRYKTNYCSNATFIVLFIACVTLILPFLFAYKSQGFWLKTGVYREQPDIHFKHEFILIINTNEISRPLICSTHPIINNILNHNYCQMIKSREADLNSDGINDELFMEINLNHPYEELISIHGVNLFLFFDYKLSSYSSLEIEGMLYYNYNSFSPGVRLDIMGDLKLNQRQPLFSHGKDTRFNKPILNYNEIVNDNFNIKKVLEDYFSRNVTTILTNSYTIWTPGYLLDESFIIDIHIKYPEQFLIYKPGFWEVIKWAWIQYISLFLIIYLITKKIKAYLFQNNLVFSIKESPLF